MWMALARYRLLDAPVGTKDVSAGISLNYYTQQLEVQNVISCTNESCALESLLWIVLKTVFTW